MSDDPYPTQQDARTKLRFLPRGATLEDITALLSDDVLKSYSIERARPDEMDTRWDGKPITHAMLRVRNLNPNDGAVSWATALWWFEDEDEFLVERELQIEGMGCGRDRNEERAAAQARVAWRLLDALEHASAQCLQEAHEPC